MAYMLIIALVGILLAIVWIAMCEDNMFSMGVAVIGFLIILGGVLFGIYLPFMQSEVKEADEIASEYKELTKEAYDTKIQHGGVSTDLYQKMEMHNEKVNNKDWNAFWCKAGGYRDGKSDYSIDLDDYKVLDGDIPENNYVQPVRIADEQSSIETTTSKPTTSTTSESTSTETEETTLKKVVEIDGQYYELVPIG